MVSEANENNQRKYPRIPLAMEFHCGTHTDPMKFVSKDLSAGGVFISTHHVYPLDASVELQVSLPYAYGELRLKGKVVRHNVDPHTGTVDGMAIEWHNLPEDEKKMISEYIRNTKDPSAAAE